jgi:hypothetical protein
VSRAEYSYYHAPTRRTGYWVVAAGYQTWHRTLEGAERTARSIRWTTPSVWTHDGDRVSR